MSFKNDQLKSNFISLNLKNNGYNSTPALRLGNSRGQGNAIVELKSDLKEVWESLFGGLSEEEGSSSGPLSIEDKIRQGRENSLPFLAGRYQDAQAKVSGTDQNKLEVHQGLIERLEQSVSGMDDVDVSKIPANPFPGSHQDNLKGFRAPLL